MADFTEFAGEWSGSNELWLDPFGNDAEISDATARVEANAIHYTWQHDGNVIEGSIELGDSVCFWTDKWHQADHTECTVHADTWALLDAFYTYAAGDGPDWGWRITVVHRAPMNQLVVQMTNVAPWGEEGRAVRMTLGRA